MHKKKGGECWRTQTARKLKPVRLTPIIYMIIHVAVILNEIFHLGRNYRGQPPKRCPRCHCFKLWGHGYRDTFFEGYSSPIPLRRWRCPQCGCVICYDDRDLVRTNLIASYDRILAFVQKHLPDPFYLKGIKRKSLRDAISREVAFNMLIHREYTNATPARLIIEYGQVNTYNANRSHGFGRLDPETFTPYPENPVTGAFFREIDRADELGSGMRNMMKYGRKYGGGDPQLIEGDVFRMIISVPEFGAIGKPDAAGGKHDEAHDEAHVTLTEIEQQMLQACQQAARSTPELLEILGYKARTGNFKKALSHLLEDEFLERTLPDKPTSKNQKYRITSMGKKILENIR
jgi:ATP-dependent DNA helicase RecG